MVDFNIFDSILDAAFVVDGDGKILYCNDAGATFCQTSVRRVVNKVLLSDLMTVQEPGLLPFTPDSQGRLSATPFIETEFNLTKAGRVGKAQLAIRPVSESTWLFFIRDVSLEEALHSKYRSELAQKEDYARNLEKLVEARTAELNAVNQTLKAILNSLGQGFFTFNAKGDCGSVFTRACEQILEGVPTQRKAWDVLAVPAEEQGQFKLWTESMFNEVLPFEEMKSLGPSLYPHSQKMHVVLDYYPIRRETSISEVVVVATDKTAEHLAQIALDNERQFASMIVKYMKNKDQFLQFFASVRLALSELITIASQPMTDINESFRILHTLEGEAGTFSLRDLRLASRASQHLLESAQGQMNPELQASFLQSLREMSVQYEQFLTSHQEIFRVPEGHVSRTVETSVDRLYLFLDEIRKLPKSSGLADRFQQEFLQVSFATCLSYYDGLIQGVAERLGKKVKPLKIVGGELRIFQEPYKNLFSGLVHAFRNAVDHGLETPDEREWEGKDPAGEIRVEVSLVSGKYSMLIADDGKGIDPSIIREKLKSKYPTRDFTTASDDEILQIVTMPGFSSRESVGEFSGRGVGLDALREEVLRLGGEIHVQSKVGLGTSIVMTFPQLETEPVVLRSA